MTEATSPESKPFARQAKWRDANPKKVWAQASLRSAVKRGIITPQPCKVCGLEPAEAHHPNYDRPADVEWYCRQHHKDEHRRMKNGAAS